MKRTAYVQRWKSADKAFSRMGTTKTTGGQNKEADGIGLV